MRLNSHIRATKIEDPTQTHNNRISWGSIIIIDNYFGTGHYGKYCSQHRPTASAGCNISHNAMCLSNYPLTSGSATVTSSLVKQSIALTRSASVPFKKQKQNHLNIITINSIGERIKRLFFIELVCSKSKIWRSRRACPNNNSYQNNSQLSWQNRAACHN